MRTKLKGNWKKKMQVSLKLCVWWFYEYIYIYTKEELFAGNLTVSGHSVGLFTNEEQKRVGI